MPRKGQRRATATKAPSKAVRAARRKGRVQGFSAEAKTPIGSFKFSKQNAGMRQSVPPMMPMSLASSATMQASFNVKSLPGYKDAVRICGQERVAAISTDVSQFSGYLLYTQLVNPSQFGPRLNKFAELYNRYVFRKISFVYVPRISPANSAAQISLMMGFDYDPDPAAVPGDVVDPSEFFTREGTVSFSCYGSAVAQLKILDPKKVYYTSEDTVDPRTNNQARFSVVLDCTGTTLPEMGTIFAQYEVDLFIPEATPGSSGLAALWAGSDDFDDGGSESNPFAIPIVEAGPNQANGVSRISELQLYYDSVEDTTVLTVPQRGTFLVVLALPCAVICEWATDSISDWRWAVTSLGAGITSLQGASDYPSDNGFPGCLAQDADDGIFANSHFFFFVSAMANTTGYGSAKVAITFGNPGGAGGSNVLSAGIAECWVFNASFSNSAGALAAARRASQARNAAWSTKLTKIVADRKAEKAGRHEVRSIASEDTVLLPP